MKDFLFLVMLSSLIAGPVPAQTIPAFSDETATAGLVHSYTGDWQFVVGGGAAVFDCDGDSKPEILMAGGSSPAGFWHNDSRDAGALAFSKTDSGLELSEVTGTYPLDIDGNGVTDVALLRVGEDVLMRGQGNCRFERMNEAIGFQGGDAWSTAFAATWEKGQSLPTLAFGAYVDRSQEAFPWGSCTPNTLHRPNGAHYGAPIALTPSFCALSMLFSDWNNSGHPSLRVSNDREYYKGGQEQMWHIDLGAAPRLYTEAEGWQRLRIWGMGIASADLNADGFPEFFLTSMADNKLQTLAKPGDAPVPKFADVAFAMGVTAHRPYVGDDLRPSTGWHAQFADVNNDGYADLFIAKGNVSAMPDFAMADPNNLLLQRPDGTFLEAGAEAGVNSTLQARGGAVVDLNADGKLDLVVVNRNGPAQVWRNVGPVGNWIEVTPLQDGANRNSINGWVEVRTQDHLQRHEITIGGGHGSGLLGPQHFGIGTASAAEVRVLWPDGSASGWQKVSANSAVTMQK